MSALEILKIARAKIALPEHWTQGTGAYTRWANQ